MVIKGNRKLIQPIFNLKSYKEVKDVCGDHKNNFVPEVCQELRKLYFSTNIIKIQQITEDKISETCSTHWEDEKCNILENLKGRNYFGRIILTR